MDQLPRLGKRELVCLLLFSCNYVVSVWRGFLFLWVLGMGYVILLWHSLSLPYNYFVGNILTSCVFINKYNSFYIEHSNDSCIGKSVHACVNTLKQPHAISYLPNQVT